MSFQYTFDSKGNTLGVFVPIQEWEKLTKVLRKRNVSKRNSKSALLGIEKGLKQVAQIEKGKVKAISIKQLLNEL